MCDVTLHNFEELCPKIIAEIKDSKFVAFDCEFTALTVDSSQETR